MSSPPVITSAPAHYDVWFSRAGVWVPFDAFDKRRLCRCLRAHSAQFAGFDREQPYQFDLPMHDVSLRQLHCIGSPLLRNAWVSRCHCRLLARSFDNVRAKFIRASSR